MAIKHHKEKIEEYELNHEARGGVAIRNFSSSDSREEHDVYTAHRDNHFLLMFATAGSLRINIDFEEKILAAPAMLVINPGQVHHIIESTGLCGWAISFDPVLMDESLRYVYEESLPWPLPIDKKANLFWQVESLMALISQTLLTKDTGRFAIQATHDLLSALLNTVAMVSSEPSPYNKEKENRGQIIEQHFKQLLRSHFKDWKQPSQYASELSVSVSHLNDTIKAITGKSVSLHIQQRSILEAKRLLHSSNLSIKEVSYDAGYEDPVYFGKLFRKTTGCSPLQFRSKFRD